MEATPMKLVGIVSTAVLSLTLVAAAPVYSQEQHEQQEEQKAKPEEQKAKPAQEEKKAQPEKSAKQEEKPAAKQGGKPEENNAKQTEKNVKPAEKNAQAQNVAANHGGRIPDDRYKANFGREHRFRVSQSDYRNHRFQYGGYAFGFVDPWPSNWLYTQDVYVVDIDGVYYLCNASYPGVNLTLNLIL
jgi:hypothetical protein